MRKVNSMLAITILLELLITGLVFGVSSGIGKSQARLDWQISYSGEIGPDDYIPQELFVDKKGNIYLTTRYHAFLMTNYSSLIKLDSDGNELWEIKYEDEGVYSSISFVGTDDQSNVYVGLSNRNTDETRIIKYDKSGTLIWEKTVIENDQNRIPPNIQMDKKGNIYLALSAIMDETTVRYTFTKVGPDGDIEWQRSQDFPSSFIFPSGRPPYVLLLLAPSPRLEVDRWGNVVTACSNEGKIVLTKYDEHGNVLWTDSFEEEDYIFSLYDIAIGNSGNICLSVTEYPNDTSGLGGLATLTHLGQDVNSLIIQYESDGNIAFILDQNMPYQARLMFDKSNNIYLAGSTMPPTFINSYNIIQKLDAEGNLQWSHISTVLAPHPLSLPSNSYRTELNEQTGNLYIVFKRSTGEKVLQKINSKGQVCYEKEFQGPDCLSGKLCALSSLSLIKDKKKGIYILETQGGIKSIGSGSVKSGYALSKFIEENIKGKGKQ